jgi:hypothetical protein
MKNKFVAITTICALFALNGGDAFSQSRLEPINYNGQQVQGYRGAPEGFPDGFLGLLCEAGAATRDDRNGCIQLNRDGTGQWEHDRSPGHRAPPPAPVTWWVLADQEGTVTRIDQEGGRRTWILIFRFEGQYYSQRPGDMMRHPASEFPVRNMTRYIVHTKFRDR